MSTYGTLFRVTTYGESHCASVGAIVDGCPPVRLLLCLEIYSAQLTFGLAEVGLGIVSTRYSAST
jgi:chorismate synthase